MQLHTFRGRETLEVFAQARAALGEDVLIVRTETHREGRLPVVEVTALAPDELERFRERLQADPLPLMGGREAGARPFVLALVGPTGAGKTTTLAKLAVHPKAFGERRVGLISLDTYRVGALEQLSTFAEITGVPLEVVYSADEVAGAMKRLADCDVVLVDTPGRSPRMPEANQEWGELLAAIRPDETHLVMPATMRLDVAGAVLDGYDALRPTHLLLSKVDEVPGESGLADLADELRLPLRWLTDGQEIPADLRPAMNRIIASIGLSTTAPRTVARVA